MWMSGFNRRGGSLAGKSALKFTLLTKITKITHVSKFTVPIELAAIDVPTYLLVYEPLTKRQSVSCKKVPPTITADGYDFICLAVPIKSGEIHLFAQRCVIMVSGCDK